MKQVPVLATAKTEQLDCSLKIPLFTDNTNIKDVRNSVT
jgi:hypothetical protein